MSYRYGYKSLQQWRTLHPWLRLILLKLLAVHDHSVNQGGRTPTEQQAFFDRGTSTLAPPNGKHLMRPDVSLQFQAGELYSLAADITPYIKGRKLVTHEEGFGPNQKAQFAYFLGLAKRIASTVLRDTGWGFRLGINWDMDAEILTDQTFQDWFHVELVWRG